jgi:hypothetical protein
MKRRMNIRRLVNSWSARALWVVAGIASASEIIPGLRDDLPSWVPGVVAGCALILRVFGPHEAKP